MSKLLLLFRNYDLAYSRQGGYGNKETLSVYLRDDNTLGYSLYGGWQDGGTPFSISNLQLKLSLPINPAPFKKTKDLEMEIRKILATGVGSHTIAKVEILNEIKNKEKSNPKTKLLTVKAIKQLRDEAQELIDCGNSHEKREGYGMMKVLNLMM